MRLEREPKCEEFLVDENLAAATQRRLTTMGEFGQFVRRYLAAGYQREVSEAHRPFFEQARCKEIVRSIVIAGADECVMRAKASASADPGLR